MRYMNKINKNPQTTKIVISNPHKIQYNLLNNS